MSKIEKYFLIKLSMNGWTLILIASLFEVGFVFFLKLSDGFSKILPSIMLLTCSLFSLYFLSKSLKYIPIGMAYSIWTGIGIIGSIFIGSIFFKDNISIVGVVLIINIVASIIFLIMSQW